MGSAIPTTRAPSSPPPIARSVRLAGIDGALDVIRAQIEAGGRITVHGDYDVDGVCATAIMVRALRALGADVDWFMPSRIDDGYGLSTATVERLAQRGTGADRDRRLRDHRRRGGRGGARRRGGGGRHRSPRAARRRRLPGLPDRAPGVCGYPCPDLCGTGVAYKLAEALGAPTAAEDLELVALATVADLVPLRGENRRLVREGLRALPTRPSPGCGR